MYTFTLINTDLDANKNRITKYRTDIKIEILSEHPIHHIEEKINKAISKNLTNSNDIFVNLVTDMRNEEIILLIYGDLYMIPISFKCEMEF